MSRSRARYLQALLVLGSLASSATAQVAIGSTIIRTGTTIEILDPSVDIQAVIDGIVDASASKPYLVKLTPGVYDLNGGDLLMREFVDLAGSGQGSTEVVSRVSSTTSCPSYSVVVMADNMELSDLTVTNDDDSIASGFRGAVCVPEGTSPRIRRVTARAVRAGTSGNLIGFALPFGDGGGEPELTDVTALADGGENAYGIYCLDGSFTLKRATVRVSGAQNFSRGIWLVGDCSPEMRQLSIDVADGLNAHGIEVQNTSKAVILQAIVEARQGTLTVGIRVNVEASPLIVDVIARAVDGTTNRGIEVLGSADPTLRRSTMSGSDAGLYSDSTETVFVTQSTLRQGTGGTGTLDCVATDDGAGSLLSASCV